MRILLALALFASPALADTTTTVAPPAYTVQPPAMTMNGVSVPMGSYRVTPPSFKVTVPTTAGPAGPKGDTGAQGPAGAAADTSALSARIGALEAAVAALQSGSIPTLPPAPAALNDPCAGGANARWTALTLTPADSIGKALACVGTGSVKLTLGAGTYRQVFNVAASTGVTQFELAGAGAGKTILDGGGGCTLDTNSSGSSCTTRLAYGNGVVRVEVPAYIHDATVTGGGKNAGANHDGQAGVYIATSRGQVTLRRLYITGNQMGVFGNAGFLTGGTDVLIDLCDFEGNSTDGGSHDTYISGKGTLTITNSVAFGSLHGNVYKTRMGTVTIQGGYIRSSDPSNPGEGGRWVDAADGAALTITGTTLVGNTCCSNILGNGSESTNAAQPNTTISGGSMWLGRDSVVNGPGPVTMSGVPMTCGQGSALSWAGGSLRCGAVGDPPGPPGYASGAK